ncbi:TA system VapC family ribonuclease toxin [Microbacterium sp.]|uniref:TA system VapC family ribonuclease toxin n=1 Tax=Microbacterium sp. TaxID=51671 RepID=UPI0039E38F8C
MIVPDVNVLVYAFRADAPEHEAYAAWLNRTIGTEPIGLADVILSGFVRIVTHSRITTAPAPIARAVEFTERLAESPRATWLTHGAPVWKQFGGLAVEDPGIRGNLVPDAYIAALCLANGARLATRDRGFARFPGLRWFDPAQ